MSQNRIGPHTALKPTLLATAQSVGSCSCFQAFLGGPLQFNTRTLTPEDSTATRAYLAANNMKCYVHAPYVINLANPLTREKGVPGLQKLLNTLASVSPDHTGTILHIGAKGTLVSVADALNSMDITSPLLLENCAGEGTKLGKSMEELHKLIELTDSHRVGLCIDTCHAHSAGMTDMRLESEVVTLFNDLDEVADRPSMFHLNDSKTKYNTHVDRHEPIGLGTIWGEGHSRHSLREFSRLATLTGRDIILETPTATLKELAYLVPDPFGEIN
jgi:deoxyribonuclease-4